jgi:hypothetical protein
VLLRRYKPLVDLLFEGFLLIPSAKALASPHKRCIGVQQYPAAVPPGTLLFPALARHTIAIEHVFPWEARYQAMPDVP